MAFTSSSSQSLILPSLKRSHPPIHPSPRRPRHLIHLPPCRATLPTPPSPPPPPSLNAEIFSLALPALGALALDPLLSLIDTAFVGRLGINPLAGVGLSTLVLNISFSIFNFLSISTTPLLATSLHPTSTTTPSSVLSASLLLSLLLGAFTTLTLTLLPAQILTALGCTPPALPFAIAYLRARAIATPLTLASFVCNGALRAIRDLKTPFFIALFANFLNLALDILLIFRLGMGVSGAAYATSISQVIACLLMLSILVRRKFLHPPDLLRIPHPAEIRPLLTAGLLLTIRTFSILATVAYATATAAALGPVRFAAYELCRQLWVFHATILDALAASAQALVASAVAAGEFLRARSVADRALLLSAIAGALLGLAACLAGEYLPAIFTTNAAVKNVAANCIAMAAVCTPLNGAVFALDGVLAACSDFKYMAVAIASAALTACVAISVVRWCGGGVVAVWAALNVLMVARAFVLGVRYASPACPIPRE